MIEVDEWAPVNVKRELLADYQAFVNMDRGQPAVRCEMDEPTDDESTDEEPTDDEPTADAAGIVAYRTAQRARGEQYSEYQEAGDTADDAIALD